MSFYNNQNVLLIPHTVCMHWNAKVIHRVIYSISLDFKTYSIYSGWNNLPYVDIYYFFINKRTGKPLTGIITPRWNRIVQLYRHKSNSIGCIDQTIMKSTINNLQNPDIFALLFSGRINIVQPYEKGKKLTVKSNFVCFCRGFSKPQ